MSAYAQHSLPLAGPFFSSMTSSSLTARQLNSLPSLTSNPPSLPSTIHLLHPLVNILTKKWLRDWLFDPRGYHVELMRSPPLQSLLCSLETLGQELPAPPTSPLCAVVHQKTGHMLFCPSLTADLITIGAGVHRGVVIHRTTGLNLKTESTTEFCVNLRFVHDARSNTLLIVMHAPEDGVYFVLCTKLEDSCTATVFSGFFTDELRSDMLQQPERSHDMLGYSREVGSLLHERLQVGQYEVHVKNCSLYRILPRSCKCVLLPEHPSHPYDFTVFSKAMVHHLVPSEALAWELLRTEQGFQQKLISSRLSLRGENNPDMKTMLTRWSLQEFARRVSESPWAGLIPAEDTTSSEPVLSCSWADDEIVPIEVPDLGIDEVQRSITGMATGESGSGTNRPTLFVQTAESKENLERSKKEQERLEREEEKKARNRASARRSNEKQKKLREELKMKLDAMKVREKELRRKDMEVRNENQKLKRKLRETEAAPL